MEYVQETTHKGGVDLNPMSHIRDPSLRIQFYRNKPKKCGIRGQGNITRKVVSSHPPNPFLMICWTRESLFLHICVVKFEQVIEFEHVGRRLIEIWLRLMDGTNCFFYTCKQQVWKYPSWTTSYSAPKEIICNIKNKRRYSNKSFVNIQQTTHLV